MEIVTQRAPPMPTMGFRDDKPSNPPLAQKEPLSSQKHANDSIDTVNDLLLEKVQECPDSVFISYPSTPRGKCDYVDYTVSDIDRFADEAARKYAASGVLPEVRIQ